MTNGTPIESGAPMAGGAAPLRPLWARFWGILVSPRAVFEELAERPAWLGATLLLSIASILITFLLYDPVILPTMLEQAERQVTSSEQLAQAEAMYASPGMKVFVCIMGGLGNVFFIVVIGLLLTAVCSFLLGSKVSWKQGFAVSSHALLVLLPRSLLALPIMFQRGTPEVSLGPGVFFPPSEAEGFAGGFLAALMGGFDLFQLWALALAVLGMAVAARQEPGRVGRVVVPGYLVIIVIWSLIAGMQPR